MCVRGRRFEAVDSVAPLPDAMSSVYDCAAWQIGNDVKRRPLGTAVFWVRGRGVIIVRFENCGWSPRQALGCSPSTPAMSTVLTRWTASTNSNYKITSIEGQG